MQLETDDDLQRMSSAVMAVLEKTGLRVEHPEVRRRLEALGGRVSHSDALVRFPEKVLLDVMTLFRDHPSRRAAREQTFPEEFTVGLGDGCFFLHDYKKNTRRKATEEDFIQIVRFCNATEEISGIHAPVELGGVPVPLMAVRMEMLLCLNTTLPCGVENNIPEQIPHLAAMRDVYNAYHDTPRQEGNAQGITSPLIFGKRAGRLLLEGMEYDFNHGIYTMPIAGANAPVTVQGCAVQGAAELLGAMSCVAACDPERLASGPLMLSGTMDMRTGKACFSSPGAMRQNVLVTEMFRRVHDVAAESNWPSYTDAVTPGLQCALERQAKLVFYTMHCGQPSFHVGDLDGASTFSPEQAVIDLDVSRSVWELAKPLAFDEESLAVSEIERVGADHGQTHLTTDFTLAHHRSAIWSPRVLPHDYWREGVGGTGEEAILAAAHEHYRKTVESYEPEPLPAGYERDLEKIMDRATEKLKDL
ncbi:MAG: trimethylamine methyltransferase family protein [Desulfobacteraceae bacterium]|nr:trimethylamine methyltransferase family protein [Desulfobacteraceae bacterium]